MWTGRLETPSLAPFVASPDEVILVMLRRAELKAGELLYDLGSGDGRILVAAARDFGANAVGVELDEERAQESLQKVRQLGLQDKVWVIQGDFMNVDVSDADVITAYLTEQGNEILRPKLERELKPGARVVSHNFELRGWTPKSIAEVDWHRVYVYENAE